MKLRTALVVVGAVFVLHIASLYLNFYNRWINYDIFMHLLGGFAIGLVGLALIQTPAAKALSLWQRLLFVVGFVSIVGITWEIGEFILDYYQQTLHVVHWQALTERDTVDDLFNDMVGALVAFLAFRKK